MKNETNIKKHPAAEMPRACPADMSPQTKAPKPLKHSEEYYRALIENAPDMIVVLNGNGTIQYTSPSAERLHGYQRQDVIGRNGFEMIHPDDMAVSYEAYTSMIDTPGLTVSKELRVKSKGGSWHYVEVSAKNLLRDPAVSGIVINYRDVTERKRAETELGESEEKYRLLMDNSGIPVAYFSLNGHVLLMNRIGARNLGGTPEDFVGKSIYEILPKMADRTQERSQRIIASGTGEEHEDLIRLPAGHRWFRSNIQPVRDAEGHVFAVQIVSQDITERKHAEEWTQVQRDLTHTLSATTKLDEALAVCVTTAINATGMDSGGAYIVDRETRGVDLVYSTGLSPDFVGRVSHYGAGSPNARLVMAGKPTYALVSELALPPDDSFHREALRAIAVIPITHEGEVIACLNVGSHTLDEIPVTSRNMIESIAAQIGGAIARLKAEEELRQYRDHLEDLVRERTIELTIANEALGEEIIERNRTEKALKESEARYRLLADNVTDVIWVRDMHLKPTYVSPSITDLLGYSVEEAMSQAIEEVVCPSSLEMVTRTLAEALAKESTRKRRILKSRTIEAELKCKDGSTIWTEITTSFLRNERGQPIGVIGVTRDITERKRAEVELRASEEKYRLIAETSTEGIYQVDTSGKFVFVNETYARILGYERAELLGKHYTIIIPEPMIPEAIRIIGGVLSNTPSKGEFTLKHKLGHGVPVYFSMGSLIRQGEPIGFSGIIEDITEREQAQAALKESEEKWRSLAQNVPSIVMTVACDGTILFINRTVPGFTKKQAIGKTIYDFVKPDHHSTVHRTIEYVIRTGQPGVYEIIGAGPEGRDSWYETHIGPIKRDGQVSVLTFINIDITERKRQEEKILQHNKELAALNAIAQTVSQSLDLDEILNNALEKVAEILSIRHILVALLDEDGEHLAMRVERGIEPREIPKWRIGEGVLGHVAQIGEPMFVDSIPDSAGLISESDVKTAIKHHVKSIMYVPLKAKGRTLGVMMSVTQGDRVLTPDERNLLITIGHHVSTAIENAMLYRELQQKEEIRRDGLRQAILAQEEERRRIARELHDQTSQVLTGASAMIEASVAALPQEYAEVKDRLQQARLSLTHMLIDVRNIIYELRPTMLDDLGLVAAARWHAEDFLGKAGVQARFETKGRKRKLPAHVETAIFRIIQEAATNIVRHAKARNAGIRLEYRKHSLGLTIKDDGKGFAMERIMHPKHGKRGLGLLSMKERAEILGGSFVIESKPDTGTLITIEIPT